MISGKQKLSAREASDIKGDELYRRTVSSERLGLTGRAIVVALLWAIPFGTIEIVLFFLIAIGYAKSVDPFGYTLILMFVIFLLWAYVTGVTTRWHIYTADVVRTGGNWFTRRFCHVNEEGIRQALGVRDASKREEDRMFDVIQQIESLGHGDIDIHENWWVIDSPQSQAWTIGQDVYLTSAAIRNSHLVAILAHEIGHLNQGDGEMVLALYTFTLPFIKKRTTSIGRLSGISEEAATDNIDLIQKFKQEAQNMALSTLFGGFGVLRLKDEWANYFRERDYLADSYVVDLDLGQELKDYLEANKHSSFAVPFLTNWNAYTELRIDRLLGQLE